ncbi:MAG: MFS transporter [Candidatus Microsaccharimonas sossegonensis]|uniref:MFS transporter n=1 Tax=Candidatus Microsaccharimonas sossegonensis TaxID=2506948 RepID=A0A4Q0AGV2_9BACT|nr:MAG: MFS transporter [Candidatus Microsaccharimonas sossegonensis]
MHHHLTLKNKIIIMLSVMASLFLVALDQTIISTALGKIVEQFNAYDSLSWIVTAYLLTTTITVPIAGKLSDIFGRRIVLLVGVGVFVVGSLMGGLSANVVQLVLWRAFQGIGAGIITANAFTIVGDLFAARERGRWQGLIGAVFGLSSVVGPLLGGFLTDNQHIFGLTTDWRWTFFINVPIGIAAFMLITIFAPALRHAAKTKIDFLGAALLTVFLGMLILAVDNTETIFKGLLDATGMTLTGLRVVMYSIVVLAGISFIAVERRVKEPILPIGFFKKKNFVLLVAVAALFGAAFMGSILYLTQFNQQVFGATPTQSGLMLLPLVGGLMITSIASGQIISRIGRYKIFMQIGFIMATIGMVALSFLNQDSPYMQEAVIMFVMGLGMGVAMPTLNLAVQNEFEQSQLGVATSANQLFRSLGSTIGTAIFGAVLTAGIVGSLGNIQSTPYVTSLSSSAQVAKLGDINNANTILTLNMPSVKKEITDGVSKSFQSLPTPIAKVAEVKFVENQKNFSSIVTRAFSESLQRIFIVAAVLMVISTTFVFALKERRLKAAKATDTPGE